MDDKFLFIMFITLTVIAIILFIWIIYISTVLNNNKLYCKHFLKKEWNLWEKIIEKLREQGGTINVFRFDNPELNSFVVNIEIDSKKYKLIYWPKRGTVSVHQGTDCTLSGFDKYHSDMAVKIMKEKIKKAFYYADEETKRITEELMEGW